MKQRLILSSIAALALATAALAHSGVKNPAVKARMDVMSAIAENMKAMGAMVKGATPYNATVAQGTARELAEHSAKVTELFETPETDPKSEASPEIWADWPGFREQSDAMTKAALSLAQVDSEDAFKAGFVALGKTCSACHKSYRIDKD
ncbi:MAG: cytochrome c [Litoreibacter sp.]|nr:cytochrome c [Litoreibacter sp.]